MFTREGLPASAGALLLMALVALPALGQSPTYGVGRPPTVEEMTRWDLAIPPSGKGLPAGRGTAVLGKAVYVARCAACHGATGKEGPNDVLVGGGGTLSSDKPLKTVGSFWPYATTLWDYLSRAMPFQQPGSLTADEAYGVTAYLLYLNGIIGEGDVIDATTLLQVQMPNRGGFVADPRPGRR
jgi:cytochrome c